jgi:hypothetical protein
MNQLTIAIAQLQLALTIARVNPQDNQIEGLLRNAIENIREAAKSLTGHDIGPGD